MIWPKDGKEMVRIPAGVFPYGDDKKRVKLPEFWIDKTPVTNAEYKRFLDANNQHPIPFVNKEWAQPYNWDKGSRSFPQDKAHHPVVLASWHDAVAYAEWAGKRLPSEREWEKAARGTGGRTYPWGNEEPTPDLCNFDDNIGGTTPVGQYSPQGDSPYGCADMAGHVWEWTTTRWKPESRSRVLRGGSWDADREGVRSAVRTGGVPDDAYDNVGFRCVRTAMP
jgi:formylglycine-generating enzyme required for sulfatase activity